MNKQNSIDVHPIVAQIINRNCHVGWSNRSVIRHVISKLRHGQKTFRAMTKEERKLLMRQCIEQHRKNGALYREVMYPNYRASEKADP